MAFGQLRVPADPKDLLLADPLASGQSAQPQSTAQPAPQQIPMQVGGTTVLTNPATGEVTATPVTSTTTKDPSESTTRVPETAKIQAAEASSSETRAMAEEASKRQAMAKVQDETFRAEQAERQNELLQRQMEEQSRLRAAEDAKVSAALTDLRARQKEASDFKPTTYREEMGVFRSAVAALGVALGQYAATKSGTPNGAFQIFQAAEGAHQAKQKAAIEQKAKAVEMATGNLQLANELRSREITALNERYLQKNKYLQGLFEAKIARVPRAAADGKAELAKLRAEYDRTEMDTAKMLAGTQTNQGVERSQTVVEGKAAAGANNPSPQFDKTMALYGDTMDAAIKEMSALPRPTQDELERAQNNESLLEAASEQNKTYGGASRTIVGRKLGLVPRTRGEGLSDTSQAYLNAMDRANEGFQRVVSGANLQEKERSRLMNQLTILPGDSEKVVQAKLAGMEREKNNFLALSGKAAAMLPGRESQPQAQAQIAQDKRDFAQERRDIAEANRLLKATDATPKQKAAARAYLDQFGKGGR